MQVMVKDGTVEIDTDGKTIWVNDATGCCIGRLCAYGIDVHKTGEEQMLGGPQCLDYAHDIPKNEMWAYFAQSMLKNHGVVIPDSVQPEWSKEAA